MVLALLVVMEVRGSRRKEADRSVGEHADEVTAPSGSAALSCHIFLFFGLELGSSSPGFDFSKGGRNFLSMAVPVHDAVSEIACALYTVEKEFAWSRASKKRKECEIEIGCWRVTKNIRRSFALGLRTRTRH